MLLIKLLTKVTYVRVYLWLITFATAHHRNCLKNIFILKIKCKIGKTLKKLPVVLVPIKRIVLRNQNDYVKIVTCLTATTFLNKNFKHEINYSQNWLECILLITKPW